MSLKREHRVRAWHGVDARCMTDTPPMATQTKDFAGPGVEGQTEQVMKNMGAVLEAAGSDFSKVVKTTILLADMDDFAAVNAVYGMWVVVMYLEQPFMVGVVVRCCAGTQSAPILLTAMYIHLLPICYPCVAVVYTHLPPPPQASISPLSPLLEQLLQSKHCH